MSATPWSCRPARAALRFLVVLVTALAFLSGHAADARAAAPDGLHDRVVTAGGVRFHFWTGGNGSPVLLLHGWPETVESWREVAPTLARHHRVIVPDLPGLGDSGTPSSFRKSAVAANLHALVQALGAPKVALVGHDIGGMVAYAYANRYPSEVTKLAVMDVPIPTTDFLSGIPLLTPGGNPAWHFGFFNVHEVPERLVGAQLPYFLRHFYRDLSFSAASYRRAFPRAKVRRLIAAYRAPRRLHNGFSYYRAFLADARDNAAFATQAPLTMPILAVVPQTDAEQLPLAAQLQARAAGPVPTTIVAGSGHWLSDEQPKVLTSRLSAFLG